MLLDTQMPLALLQELLIVQSLAGIGRKPLIHFGDCLLICSVQLAVRVARMV